MITIKQIEAIYWIGRLGSFEAAARHLGTSQSAITRRIQDLETATRTSLFDRSTRTPTLNEKGQSAYRQAASILDLAGQMMDSLAATDLVDRSLDLGVTEVSALTWIPGFLAAMASSHPKLTLRLRVAGAEQLRDMLAKKQIDLAVLPEALWPPGFVAEPIAPLRASFCCARGRLPEGVPVTRELLQELHFIMQENVLFSQVIWRELAGTGAGSIPVVVSDGLLSSLAQVAAGRGVSLLPDFLLDAPAFGNAIQRLTTEIALPPLPYVAIFLEERQSSGMSTLIGSMRTACHFDKMMGA